MLVDLVVSLLQQFICALAITEGTEKAKTFCQTGTNFSSSFTVIS